MMFGMGQQGTTNLITKALQAAGKELETIPDPTQIHYHLPKSAAHPEVPAHSRSKTCTKPDASYTGLTNPLRGRLLRRSRVVWAERHVERSSSGSLVSALPAVYTHQVPHDTISPREATKLLQFACQTLRCHVSSMLFLVNLKCNRCHASLQDPADKHSNESAAWHCQSAKPRMF